MVPMNVESVNHAVPHTFTSFPLTQVNFAFVVRVDGPAPRTPRHAKLRTSGPRTRGAGRVVCVDQPAHAIGWFWATREHWPTARRRAPAGVTLAVQLACVTALRFTQHALTPPRCVTADNLF
jgi:hypothetical protein